MLASKFLVILRIELLELELVVLLQFSQLFVFVLNLLLLGFNQFFLPLNLSLHLSSFLVLVILVLFHVGLQVLLDLLHIVNFSLLLLEQVLSLF